MTTKSRATKNNFDCLKMKERVQATMHRAMRTMTTRQKLAYIRQRAANGPLAGWWQQAVTRTARRKVATS